MTSSHATHTAPSHPWAAFRVGRIALRMLVAVTIVGGAIAGGTAAGGAAASDTAAGSTAASGTAVGSTAAATRLASGGAVFAAATACANGVTVVVDFTDLGGAVEAACAEGDQATGRDALVAAGFTPTDSQPGFLCAINSMPNPCPETFDGSFWSYWHSTANGEWTSYQVGADSSAPVTGDIEGWRYNDGTTPPGVVPAQVSTLLAAPAPNATTNATTEENAPGTDEAVTTTQDPLQAERADQYAVLTIVAVGFLALVVILAVFLFLRARNQRPNSGVDSAAGSRAAAASNATPDANAAPDANSDSNPSSTPGR